ncbi:flagellin [Peptococcaceae bacterium 1198_IL3148]
MYVNGKQLININSRMKRTQNSVQKSLEKLSSGLRINSAADDAAGLAISQKLLALARGSEMALRNVQDASSLVQVADGAMEDITNIIHRIRELTVKAMNGTNTEPEKGVPISLSTADTIMIQNEIDELKKGLNDLVKHTEFNQTKLLTNVQPDAYIYEDRSVAKTIQLSQYSHTNDIEITENLRDYKFLYPDPVISNQNFTKTPYIYTHTVSLQTYTGSTVVDYKPQWSEDGQSIVFKSTRDGGTYVIPADGSAAPAINESVSPVPTLDISGNGLMRLTVSDNYLNLEVRTNTSSDWIELKRYNYNDKYGGYSFSPKVDEAGDTSFVFSDERGNLTKVNVNINSLKIIGEKELINTDDTLNIPPVNNTIILDSAPNLYRMNTSSASLQIEKITDSGARILTYWDGTGTAPTDGYYTVSGNEITFHGEAIIGHETETDDDGQDYYKFSLVSDDTQNGIYTATIPSGAEIYNMHGESGPRSLDIRVGGKTVSREQLLSSRPEDVEGTTGVYVDEVTGKIEFYGDLRPAHNEDVFIDYISDTDGRNEITTYYISTNIDTYNLTDADLTKNRSLRVYVGGLEIAYDATKTNGYTYNPLNGRISLYGDARPDLPAGQKIEVKYVLDASGTGTTKDVYGITLSRKPEIYNLDNDTSPQSIRVYRNETEEIKYSASDGFQYNESTNTIELYGASRPDVGDTYKVEMVVGTGVSVTDGIVEISLDKRPETYGIADPEISSTFRVLVNGVQVNYDPNKVNGYFYNSDTNRIEIYGDARPEVSNNYSPDVSVYYVFENSVVTVGNSVYDFQLPSSTLDYGVATRSEPRAIRVYQNGTDIPHDASNGFTYDAATKQLSLHGNYRPAANDYQGKYSVYSINAEDLIADIPQDRYIYRVELNGQEIEEAQDATGDGYFYNGQYVEIVGDARPNVTKDMGQIHLNVVYSDSFKISLDNDAASFFYNNYCDHEKNNALLDAEIDPTSLSVFLDGKELSAEQYTLKGKEIILNRGKISLSLGSHNLAVNYKVRQPTGHQPNKFTFQVGANSGQTLDVEIQSFDNMLRGTNIICVRTHEDAQKGLQVIDKAFEFVMHQRANIGAVQNRLASIATNLSVTGENTLSSLSRIEDADMAKEIMNQTKNSILAQATQALMVHTNQQSQGVLQLLK